MNNFKSAITGFILLLLVGVIGVTGISFALDGWYIVDETEVGIVKTFGKINQEPVGAGLHFKLPVVQSVVKMNTYEKTLDMTQKQGNAIKALTAEGLPVVIDISIIVLAYVLGVRAFIDLYEFSYLLLALFLVLGFIYPRFFCKYVCPVGALLSILARFSIFKLELDKNKCIGCRLCEFKCPMQIKIVDVDKIDQMECVRCFECMSACRKDAIKFGR